MLSEPDLAPLRASVESIIDFEDAIERAGGEIESRYIEALKRLPELRGLDDEDGRRRRGNHIDACRAFGDIHVLMVRIIAQVVALSCNDSERKSVRLPEEIVAFERSAFAASRVTNAARILYEFSRYTIPSARVMESQSAVA